MQIKSNSERQTSRLYYLDWLRVIAILSVFLYHCDRFFDFRDYPIQTTVRSLASTIHREFSQIWLMPIFFTISGAAIFFSLQSGRKVKIFIKDKILRLLVPLIIIGVFVMAPPQIYLERIMNGQFSGSFFHWYPQYFNGIYGIQPTGNFAFQGMHLWYLMVLFFYSLILLPLFVPMNKTGMSIISRVSNLFDSLWALLLLFAPIAASSILVDVLKMGSMRIMGGWDQFSYMFFFIYGYLIFSNKRIQEIIKNRYLVFLIASILLTVLYLYTEFVINAPEISVINRFNLDMKSESAEITFGWCCILTLRSIISWCWILSLLGLGSRFLNYKNKMLEYANEAVLPFYIIHQTVLLIIGFYVIQWNIGIPLKYTTITITSFIVIMVLYEYMVRRINILRFLFGMKWNRK